MRVHFFSLAFETPRITFYLWSPWRATALEHRLFDTISRLNGTEPEDGPDEQRLHVSDEETWQAALKTVARVLKGWQEEADPGGERRAWRWLLEAETDPDGFDPSGEPASLWGFLRLSIDRGGPGEADKSEDIDLEGFGLRVWGEPAGS